MSFTPISAPGKGSFTKKGRIPKVGQQYSLDTSDPRTPGGLSRLSTNSDGSLTRRKALASLESAENITVPNRDLFNKAGKIPGISASNLSKTKRHDHDEPKSALDIELPRKDPFTKSAKIPEILGSEHRKTKRHDHDEPKNAIDSEVLSTKDPFSKSAKIPGILGSELGKTKRHDHDEPKSSLESGLLSTKDPFSKSAKIPGILGSELGKTKRHDHDEPKSSLESELLSTANPFTKSAKIPGILGSELGKTKRHDHDEPKSSLESGLLSTANPFTKSAKIPGISGSKNGKTKRHDHDGPSTELEQEQKYSSKVGKNSLQPTDSQGKLSMESDGTLSRRKSLAPIGNGLDTAVLSGDSSPKAAKPQGTARSPAAHKKHKQEFDIRKELETRVSGDSVGVKCEGPYSYQSTDDEEEFYKHILAQGKPQGQGLQQHQVVQLQQSQSSSKGADEGNATQTSKKTKKKSKKNDKKDKGKKKSTSAVWPNVTRGHKFEDLPHFRQIRMAYPNDPYHGLPPWAKFFPTPPGHEKMPIPEMYQGGATLFNMASEYDRMYGYEGYEGTPYGRNAGHPYQGMYDGTHDARHPHPGMYEGMHDVRPHPGMYGGMHGVRPHPGMYEGMHDARHPHPGMFEGVPAARHPHPGMYEGMQDGRHPYQGMHGRM